MAPPFYVPEHLGGIEEGPTLPGARSTSHWVPEVLLTHPELARTRQQYISQARRWQDSSKLSSAGPARRRAESAGAALESAQGHSPAGNRLPPP